MAEDTEVEVVPHSNGVTNGDHALPTESPSSTTLPELTANTSNGKLSKSEKLKQKKQKQKQSKQLRRYLGSPTWLVVSFRTRTPPRRCMLTDSEPCSVI